MTDDLRSLAASFYAASEGALSETRKVVNKGALNVKTDWRRRWRGLQNLPRLAYSVGYDLYTGPDSVLAVIGPDVDDHYNQGPLGGLMEFGNPHNPGHPAGLPALLEEEPVFIDQLAAMGERLLDGRA